MKPKPEIFEGSIAVPVRAPPARMMELVGVRAARSSVPPIPEDPLATVPPVKTFVTWLLIPLTVMEPVPKEAALPAVTTPALMTVPPV